MVADGSTYDRLSGLSLQVYRDHHVGSYRSVQTYAGQDETRPLAVPNVVLRPVALWES